MTTRQAWIVVPPAAGDRELLEAAAEALGLTPRWLSIKPGLPRRTGRVHRKAAKQFTATPPALVASWQAARHLDARTEPGDVVVALDRAGLAGVFALEQVARPEDARRVIAVVAGEGVGIRTLEVAGTVDGLDGEDAAAVDWEIVGYHHADLVLASSERARDAVRALGAESELFVAPDPLEDAPPGRALVRLWAPEPFSREAQTPAICRAVAAVRRQYPGVQLTVSTEDAPDRIWSGTAWDAARGVREVLGEALRRATADPRADAVVLGDPFRVSPPEAQRVRRRGVPVVVPHGSAAAARWPDAPTWRNEEELAALLSAGAEGRALASAPAAGPRAADLSAPAPAGIPAPERARRVSAAVPVFRDVRFLDEAVASLLAQEQPFHEILLVDDGSASAEVTSALQRWAWREPGLVRLLEQPNRGVCAARNLALEHMTGDAFVLLDQDDVLEPDFVSACAQVLRSREDVWVVAAWTAFFGAYEGVEAKPPFDARVGRRENPIVSTCALVDMRVRDLGVRFADDLAWLYCEDWDVWARIIAAGGRFGLVPRALARHRVHPESGGHQRTELAQRLGRARATARLSG